jgi:hypothetical protein
VTAADRAVLGILLFALPAVNLYPIFYAFRPWRSTHQGQALMLKAIGNLIVLDVVLLYTAFGDYPLRNVVRIIGFSTFTMGVWYLLISLLIAPNSENYPPRSWLRRRRRSS